LYTKRKRERKFLEISVRHCGVRVSVEKTVPLTTLSRNMANENEPHAGDEILDEMIHLLRYGLSSTNQSGQEAGKND
jgi:hypothetical protein